MRSCLSVLATIFMLAGCGQADYGAPSMYESAKSEVARSPNALDSALAYSSGNSHAESGETSDFSGVDKSAGGQPAKPETSTRKIIYTASLDMVVEQFSGVATEIRKHIEKHQGYVAKYREDRNQGSSITGYWTVRVPVARFDAFVEAVADLGVVESKQVDSQDVTEEFVDLTARTANKKKLEERILELLEKREGKIQDVIAVETELGRVREEIERMEGRLRLLASQTSMTTVTLSVREEKDYTPPKAPTFTTQVASTWSGSLESLQNAGQKFALFLVAFTPWAVVGLVVLVPVAMLWKRRRKQATSV